MRRFELIFEQSTGIELLNPFYDAERFDVIEIDAGRRDRYENLSHLELVAHDLNLVRGCDGLVAYMPGNCFSVGTICETWYAMVVMPVFIVSQQHAEHPWIKFMAETSGGKVFRDWQQLQQYFSDPK